MFGRTSQEKKEVNATADYLEKTGKLSRGSEGLPGSVLRQGEGNSSLAAFQSCLCPGTCSRSADHLGTWQGEGKFLGARSQKFYLVTAW